MSREPLGRTLTNLDDETAAMTVELKSEQINPFGASSTQMRKRTCEAALSQSGGNDIPERFLHLVLGVSHGIF
jgi:hypothetical protein